MNLEIRILLFDDHADVLDEHSGVQLHPGILDNLGTLRKDLETDLHLQLFNELGIFGQRQTDSEDIVGILGHPITAFPGFFIFDLGPRFQDKDGPAVDLRVLEALKRVPITVSLVKRKQLVLGH
jgi:hypothetical protein